MHWNENNDIIMMRHVAAVGVFHHKAGSRERGQLLQTVMEQLNEIGGFEVSKLNEIGGFEEFVTGLQC